MEERAETHLFRAALHIIMTMCVFASPLVVAGIVIGLVLLLSLIVIIVGSMRKKKSSHLNFDGLSLGGSIGELRSECIDEFSPAFDFDFYTDGFVYPDAPPHYDECVGPGATQIFVPTDDPPPYSHPCLDGWELGAGSWLLASDVCRRPVEPRNFRERRIASVSVLPSSLDELPSYEAVTEQRNQSIPLVSIHTMKHNGLFWLFVPRLPKGLVVKSGQVWW
ncbi:protein BEAN1 [Trichomycterus rosablanca]|uniref:protein BEAN1 n=1 Tax=Trichomycterus rosablanca TaxID=2290929 RepID=UPI002F3601DB